MDIIFKDDDPIAYPYGYYYNNEVYCNDYIELINFNYETSWDWLMPVVEKIEKEGYEVDIYSNKCEMATNFGSTLLNPILYDKGSKIESTWLACVQFIQWYNQNKK